MLIGDIVYLPFNEGYVKYIIRRISDDELLVITPKTKQLNWLSKGDILNENQFSNIYNNEIIYE